MTTPRPSAIFVAGLALALLATACGSTASTPAPSPTQDHVTSAPPATRGPTASDGEGTRSEAPPAVVPEILDFEAPIVGGGTLAGAELAGAPVAVWFWAPW